ncbi:MAG: 7-carboxy-7-deazaguanine synthase QueE [Magnetococcales bacterium]|nr:7-carboxy-7-deazaguanine synthase QueE [Magnetococcales bacterium]
MNPLPKVEPSYPICDLFASIQGEATWTGRATFFVRFSGCPLSCPWCDEPKHRDPTAARHLTAGEILAQLRAIDPILRHIVLTGGEPLAVQGLSELVDFFKKHGYWLAMETSGVGGAVPSGLDWVTLSPKTPLPESLFAMAHEIKYIVPPTPARRQEREIQQRAQRHANVWVQPQSERGEGEAGRPPLDSRALHNCLVHIKRSGGKIRLSLQTHKWIGLP